MKKLTDYIQESQQWMESPDEGDTFGIELEDDTLLETYVMEVADDGSVLLDSTPEIYSLLESWNMLSEDIDTDVEEDIDSDRVTKGYGRRNRNGLEEVAPLVAMAGGALARAAAKNVAAKIGDALDDEEPVNEFDMDVRPDPGEYDTEGDMAKNELLTIIRAARKLTGMLDNDANMPEWTQKKITKAADYVDTAADYISSQKERGVMERFAKDPGKLDLLANPTKSQVWARYMQIYDYEGYQGEENSQEMQDLEDYAAQRFGQDMVNDMMKAGYYSYFGRPADPKKPIDQGSGNYTGLGRSPISDKDIKKSGTLNKRATAGTKDRILSRLGKHPKPALPEGQSEETSPVARAVLHRIMMAHPGVLATHGPERVMLAVDELADRVNIGPDDEIGTSDVSGWVRDVIRMLAELPDESMSDVDRLKEGPNDGTEDNFTVDDIKRLEQIRDLETLKAQAKELIKGKPARRMKPEKIGWFYDHIDTLKSPLAIIKMMYDLMLAGEGHKVIGSRNSMSSNSYRTRFGEQSMDEAEYQGRDVQLGKPTRGDVKKFKVYVRDPKTGNVKKVNFGDPNMRIKKSNPARRKSFRARHKCDTAKDRTTARYWSCRKW